MSLAGLSVRRSGFTLVELMVALAIFALLIMLAGPSLTTFLANTQTRSAAEAILNGVQQAQATAMRENLPTQLTLNKTTGTGGWEIIATDPQTNTVPAPDPANPCDVRGGPQGLNPVKLFCLKDGAPYAAIASTPSGATAITFDGFGRIQCNTDAALACDGSSNLEWIKVTNSNNPGAREMHVCITDRQAPNAAGSVPVAASQIKLCDPNVAATEPQACPASCT
jgi:type IV fimbrial biogenesis protein FimT